MCSISVEKMIKSAAKAHGLSVAKMAFRAEIDPQVLRNTMRRGGGITTTTICRLASALKISPSEFLKYGEE